MVGLILSLLLSMISSDIVETLLLFTKFHDKYVWDKIVDNSSIYMYLLISRCNIYWEHNLITWRSFELVL
jgi:hypothetical protein